MQKYQSEFLWFSRLALVLVAWLAVTPSAGAAQGGAYPGEHPAGFKPLLSPLVWHREHWRQRSHRDPSFTIELPWSLFDPYFSWGHAPRPGEPPRPDGMRQRERGDMWRDDVVGSGSGGRIEVHPEGRILRSRPRSD
ncbi:hypothetical protein ACUY1T_11535 [Billgrantia sp. Q4P2]|uniref:hypothetical protein n=1 Tax=Billgrantia sp. Q4P2 TaxID=3463857 RepID=UPI0040567C70